IHHGAEFLDRHFCVAGLLSCDRGDQPGDEAPAERRIARAGVRAYRAAERRATKMARATVAPGRYSGGRLDASQSFVLVGELCKLISGRNQLQKWNHFLDGAGSS